MAGTLGPPKHQLTHQVPAGGLSLQSRGARAAHPPGRARDSAPGTAKEKALRPFLSMDALSLGRWGS